MRLQAPASPFRVERVEPPDGARGVLRGDPVLVRFSAPVDAERLHEATLEIRGPDGPVPARIQILDRGRVVVWWPRRLLSPHKEHCVVAQGLKDRQGREAPPLTSRFTPGPLHAGELRCERDALL